MTLFVSYSRYDAKAAVSLAALLRKEGLNVWIDQADISPGARWDSAIETALRDCSGLLALLSPSSVSSQNVLDEIGLALDLRKPVLPILLAECDVPLRIRRIQRVPYAGSLQLLARSVIQAVPVTIGSRGDPQVSIERETAKPTVGAALPQSAVAKPPVAAKRKKPKGPRPPVPLAERSLAALIRLRTERYLGIRAIEFTMSEVASVMPGEHKRLGIQRDLFAAEYEDIQLEISRRSSSTDRSDA